MIAREVDFPPVWLAGFAAVGFAASRFQAMPFPGSRELGAVVVIFSLALMVMAVLQMVWARTTVIPERDPAVLLTRGVFRFSRNPIYLADAIFLAGLYLAWGVWFAVPLVFVFMWLISNRFIKTEEERIAAIFGEEFVAYRAQTRRWI